MIRALRLVAAAFATVAAPLAAQQDTPLRVGTPHAGTLAAAARHTYVLTLGDSTYVYGHVRQINVDVEVTVLDPAGKQVLKVDGPARGPETFSFTATGAGRYVIAVTPFEKQVGDYEVLIRKAERVATDPARRIDQLMTAYSGTDSPGAVVGVVNRGQLVFSRAYGMADLTFGVPHRLDTPTNIGSVTKQFTGMAILLLQNDGKLTLDDDVRKYIPELPDFGAPVTLRNLLNHTGGYREIYNFLPMDGRDGEDLIRREDAIRIVQRQPEPQAAPDTEYNYNNTGYILLATVIERVSGKTYAEFLQERIFRPLGMNDTRVRYERGQVIAGASTPYTRGRNGEWVVVRDLAASPGAGSIYSTLPDMVKWMRNYTDATVGGQEAVQLLTTRNVLAKGDTTPYGLGIGVAKRRGRVVYQHTGGDVAHRTYFSYFPELQAGFFLSSNNPSFGASYSSVPELEQLFLGSRMDPVAPARTADAGAAATMSPERKSAIAGEWLIEAVGLGITFRIEGASFIAQATGQGAQTLTVTSDTSVAVPAIDAAFFFHPAPDGTIARGTFTQGGNRSPMTRRAVEALSAESLSALAGRYYGRELEVWLDVRVSGKTLVVHRIRGDSITLQHKSGSTFTGGFPFAEVEFVKAANGAVTALRAGNGRTKGVRFERQ